MATSDHGHFRFQEGLAAYLTDWKGSGVLGRLEYWKNVPSKFLSVTRNIEIWLPPGYDDNSTTATTCFTCTMGRICLIHARQHGRGLGCGRSRHAQRERW